VGALLKGGKELREAGGGQLLRELPRLVGGGGRRSSSSSVVCAGASEERAKRGQKKGFV
jgi:hypothetical protein